jgi:glycosyltransferase involved in cell wall biosynthesis
MVLFMNISIFSSTAWSFLWQRPQQVAARLAQKGFNITYVELPAPLSHWQVINDFKTRDLFVIRNVANNLSVVKPYYPYMGRNFKSFNQILMRTTLSAYFDCFRSNVAILYSVDYAFMIEKLAARKINFLYECVDEISGFSGAPPEILKLERSLILGASHVVTTARALYSKVLPLNRNCSYIPNGADFGHFNRACKLTKVPKDISRLKKPIIGFIGALWDWIDVDLICYLAKEYPEYTILLVGPIASGIDKIKNYSNIIAVGTKPYAVLPYYLSSMDICLIPFKINKLTLATNPIKMYEYLAAGKPVVSTNLPEVRTNASQIVKIGIDKTDFVKKVETAIAEARAPDESIRIAERIAFAKENSWEHRVEQIAKILEDLGKHKKK